MKPDQLTHNSHYRLRQIATHRDYVEWQASILENKTKVKIDLIPAFLDKRGFHIQDTLLLRTQALPFFTRYRDRIYLDNVKRVDPHGLKLFDAETAAIWFMDDAASGYKIRSRGTIYRRVEFCTDSYSFGDCLLLRQVMKDVLNVWGSVTPYKKVHYRIYYQGKDADLLLTQISSFIQPSFQYKLDSLSYDMPLIENESDEIVQTSEESLELGRNDLTTAEAV